MSSEAEATPSAVRLLREMWEHKTWQLLGPGWNAAIAEWIGKFSFGLVADAMQKASAARYTEDEKRITPDIRDVPKFATVQQAEERELGMENCYLVRGRIRKKFFCEDDDSEVLSLLKNAMRAGVSASAMHRAVDENNTLEDCFVSMGMDKFEFRAAMGRPIVDLPLRGQVFISERDPEWRLWDAYWSKTKGMSPPMNKNFGWFFPSRLPPADAPLRRRAGRSSPASPLS